MKNFISVTLTACLLFLFASAGHAGVPMETLRKNVDEVLNVLKNPVKKKEFVKDIKNDKISPIYEKMFDDVELSKRVLARNWNKLTIPQRKEFVILFRQLLERSYGDKIVSYTDEKVFFDRETILSEGIAEVKTRVVSAGREIPVNYMMIQKDGTWKVYDVVIENVSLVQNYRAQFNEILSGNPIDYLLDILRKKVKEK